MFRCCGQSTLAKKVSLLAFKRFLQFFVYLLLVSIKIAIIVVIMRTSFYEALGARHMSSIPKISHGVSEVFSNIFDLS